MIRRGVKCSGSWMLHNVPAEDPQMTSARSWSSVGPESPIVTGRRSAFGRCEVRTLMIEPPVTPGCGRPHSSRVSGHHVFGRGKMGAVTSRVQP